MGNAEWEPHERLRGSIGVGESQEGCRPFLVPDSPGQHFQLHFEEKKYNVTSTYRPSLTSSLAHWGS